MRIFLSCLIVLMLCAGCSCTPQGSVSSTPSPSPLTSPQPTPTPSSNENTMSSTAKDYVDYLAEKYTLNDPAPIENLDENALDGYTFGLNNEVYYLVLLDNTGSAKNWLNDVSNNGQIDVDVDGLTKTMNALINGNFILLTPASNYLDGFKDYYDAFSGAQALPDSNTPQPTVNP